MIDDFFIFMFYSFCQQFIKLAQRLPTGLVDPRAEEKFERELVELQAAIADDDKIGALLEAGDCIYYACKIYGNSKEEALDLENALGRCQRVSDLLPQVAVQQLVIVGLIKYNLRARPGNPKNDVEERAAVARLLAGWK